MLSFDQLPGIFRDNIRALPVQRRATWEAYGGILAADALAAWDLPRFDNSAMDGYAVAYQDGQALRAYKVQQDVLSAGDETLPVLQRGCALKIATGAPIPVGTDAVIPIEDVTVEGEILVHNAPARAGAHIRRQGEELKTGDLVLKKGQQVHAVAAASAAAAGVDQLQVYRPLRVLIAVTGDELSSSGTVPGAHAVIDTNGPLLQQLLQRWPVVVERRNVEDTATALTEMLAQAADTFDLVLTTGGVSMGHKDYVRRAATATGFEEVFWRVAMKPGKPLLYTRNGNCHLLGIPGNPAAVAVAAYAVLPMVLQAFMPVSRAWDQRVPCRLQQPAKMHETRTAFQWVRLHTEQDELQAELVQKAGSNMLSGAGTSNGMVRIPAGQGELPAGTVLQAWLL